jgi:hypothetical protein
VLLLDKSFEKQRKALERAQKAERELFAAKLIQRRTNTRFNKGEQEKEQSERELSRQRALEGAAQGLKEAAEMLRQFEEEKAQHAEKDANVLKLHARDGHEEPLAHWIRRMIKYLLGKEKEHAHHFISNKYFTVSALRAHAPHRPRADRSADRSALHAHARARAARMS